MLVYITCFGSGDGILGSKSNFFIKHLAEHLPAKWENQCCHGPWVGWSHTFCLQFFELLYFALTASRQIGIHRKLLVGPLCLKQFDSLLYLCRRIFVISVYCFVWCSVFILTNSTCPVNASGIASGHTYFTSNTENNQEITLQQQKIPWIHHPMGSRQCIIYNVNCSVH